MSIAEAWRKAKKTSRLLTRSEWRRGLLHGVAATVEHTPLKTMIHPRTVIDVGANKGQFTLFALEAWPGCRVIAYEPLPEPAAIFCKLFADNPNVELHQLAVGREAGSATMHVSNREDSSSLLPMSAKHAAYFAGTHAVAQREVPVVRLDGHLASANLTQPVLLKLDIQGYEGEALRGALALWPHIAYVYLETSLEELYEGQVLDEEIIAALEAACFSRIWTQAAQTANGVVVQADSLFLRKINCSNMR